MPEPRLDLHMHSDRSDGKYAPAEVLARAAAGKLDVIALSDHDLPPVLPPGTHDVAGHPIRVLAAAEVSGQHDGREFHLLVYFPGEPPLSYCDFLRERAIERASRYDEAVARLGVAMPPADEDARAGRRSLTRHHLFQGLLDAGVVRNHHDAWALLSGSRKVPLITLTFVDAIRTARAAGAYTSWAHPSLADAQKYVATFATAGLQALEGVRPGLERTTRNGLKRLAKRHGLALTGGSDWHGWWQGNLGDFVFTGEHAQQFSSALGI